MLRWGFFFCCRSVLVLAYSPQGETNMDIGTEDLPSERGELHFLAALID